MGSDEEGGGEKEEAVSIAGEMQDLKEQITSMTASKQAEEVDVTPLEEFTESVEKLEESIHRLINIFEEAGKILHEEEEKHDKRLDKVLEQNKEIANGIIAVSNMVKDVKENTEGLGERQSRPQGRSQSQPQPQQEESYHGDPPENYEQDYQSSYRQEQRREQQSPPKGPPKHPDEKEGGDYPSPPSPDEDEVPEPPEEEEGGFFSRFKK